MSLCVCVCVRAPSAMRRKSECVDLMSRSLSLSDLSHRCVTVTRGGVKSNI